MSIVRFGLIGYGAWGAHHARAISSVSRARLTAICAPSQAARQQAQASYPDAQLYSDYREMLAQAAIDAVAVVVPSDAHFEIAQAVLKSGRHLLLEKPMALEVAHCNELVELARRQGKLLAVGHELRCSSLWGRVKELIDSGAVGEPLYALIELWRRPYRLGSGGWRYNQERVGNWALEEPIHFFDLARWYFAQVGEPVSVYARGNSKRPDHPQLHDNFSAIVNFPGGRYAVISQTLAGWEHHQTVKLTGTKGALWARWGGTTDRTFEPTFQLHLQRGDFGEEVPIPRAAGEVYELVEQAEAFVRSALEGAEPICSGDDGRWSVAMCLKAQESIERGVPVRFEQE